MDMRALIDAVEGLKLYHGTCEDNADALCRNGWQPNAAPSGANQGQRRYLYVSTVEEDALWFASEKGCSAVVMIQSVPLDSLAVDPEDGIGQTIEQELAYAKKIGFPAKLVITKPVSADHFTRVR
jgi:hypothetical protein